MEGRGILAVNAALATVMAAGFCWGALTSPMPTGGAPDVAWVAARTAAVLVAAFAVPCAATAALRVTRPGEGGMPMGQVRAHAAAILATGLVHAVAVLLAPTLIRSGALMAVVAGIYAPVCMGWVNGLAERVVDGTEWRRASTGA